MNLNKAYKLINNYEVISFDVFDTLICRDVNHYENVFTILENRAMTLYGDRFKGLFQKRIKGEKIARELKKGEVTLDEIYANINIENKEEIMHLEQEIEINLCQRNKDIYPLFLYCKQKNKRIIIISDMYLNADVIERILSENGYKGYDKLYLSSEIGKQKRSGDLFKYVLQNEKIPSKQLLHIGDNMRNDVVNARLKKISTFIVEKKKNTNNPIFSFTCNHMNEGSNLYYELGYKVYGLLLLGFCQWINERLTEHKINKLYFASRDCYIVYKCFEILYPNYETYYMKVSRRSVQVPTINYNNQGFSLFSELSSFDPISDNIKIYNRIGLEKKSFISHIDVLQKNINDFLQNDQFIVENINEIYKNAEEERAAFEKYLNDISFNGKVAFIDVGWKCSTQRVLDRLSSAKILGLYLGIHPETSDSINGEGYLFNREYSDYFYSVMGGMSLIELFFTTNEYSLKKYKIENGKVQFIYDTRERINEDSDIFELQKGALQFISDINNSALKSITLNKKDAFHALKKVIESPNKEEIYNFGILPFENEGKVVPIIDNKNNIFNLRSILKDYGQSGWKIGYLKKLLKIPMPYKNLFKFTYDLYKKGGNK